MKKGTSKLLCAAVAAGMVFSACSKEQGRDGQSETEGSETFAAGETVQGEAATTAASSEPIKAIFAEIRTEYNTSLDLSDYPLTENKAGDFFLTLEAEDAALGGSCTPQGGEGYSGDAFVTLGQGGDRITFTANIENTGFYDLNFVSHAGDSGRENFVYIDGENSGSIVCNSDGALVDSMLKNIYLEAGAREISIVPSWGYTDFDCLKITAGNAVTADSYNNVAENLSNPNADERTKSLYKFLRDVYGKYSLTGQFADKGRLSSELSQIEKTTGKQFAVLGLDMMDYSAANVEHGASGMEVEYAYDWYENAGGIVQFCWHWNSPEEYAMNSEGHPWYSSFYIEHSKIDLDKIMNGEDERGYELLMADIDNISVQLARLRDAGVPVIWRPLHEAAGGWFWWGSCKPESYKKLWNVMYDKMTNEHNLTNLIWMWNGQDEEWYPGDDCVDIISWDIYQGNNVYTSFSGTFARAAACGNKLVALSENGCVMDPDLVMRDNARWLFWGTWADPFTIKMGLINEEYTSKEMLTKAYNHDRTLTLDELPDLKNY